MICVLPRLIGEMIIFFSLQGNIYSKILEMKQLQSIFLYIFFQWEKWRLNKSLEIISPHHVLMEEFDLQNSLSLNCN